MTFHSGARTTAAIALYFLTVVSTICGVQRAAAQTDQTAPPQAPPVNGAVAGDDATKKPVKAADKIKMLKPGKTAAKAAVAKPESHDAAAAAGVTLSDGHRQYHPSLAQLGINSGSVDDQMVRAYLAKIARQVDRSPRRSRIVTQGRTARNPVAVRSSSIPIPAKILPAREGAKLDIDASADAIETGLAPGSAPSRIMLVVKTTPAPDASDKFQGIDARIAHFVTHFNPGERGRTQTVRRAISLIDGRVVPPGGTLSVNQSVGERTAARGFGTGIVFVDGKLDTQLGGGMCQVATTLFNAALLANLKIVERHQHVRTVPYVKPGQDATVYWGQKDFKFENDTQAPIYISYKTTATHAICDLYGKANPTVKVRIHDDYQKLGPRHYKAVLDRIVVNNGSTKVNYTAKSAYKWTPALDYNQ